MLEQKLTELFEVVEPAAMWTAEQMPLVVKELFAWKTCAYIAGLIISIAIIIATKKRIADHDSHSNDWMDAPYAMMGTILLFFIGLIWHTYILYNLVQIIFAPRIWLIEYIGRLI